MTHHSPLEKTDDPYGEIEYGYRTPDGEDHFGIMAAYARPGGKLLDLTSKEGQGIAQDNFVRAVSVTGVPLGDMQLVFLKRVRFVNYSTPEVI